jgi:membrane-bound serine protease (ClpP class)
MNPASAVAGGRMELLLDPNIAYLVLMTALVFVLAAIVTPGTGVPEVLAVFSMAAAGYAVYRLSLNLWALALLAASLVPFYYAVRGPRRELWLAVSIAGLTAGSIFFFPARTGWLSVHPLLALTVSGLFAVLLWISARKVVQIAAARPAHELSALIGERGETRTDVKEGGSVQVASELWSARSATLIPAGRLVQVVGRDGLVLIVEERTS